MLATVMGVLSMMDVVALGTVFFSAEMEGEGCNGQKGGY